MSIRDIEVAGQTISRGEVRSRVYAVAFRPETELVSVKLQAPLAINSVCGRFNDHTKPLRCEPVHGSGPLTAAEQSIALNSMLSFGDGDDDDSAIYGYLPLDHCFTEREEPAVDDDGEPVFDDDGEPVMEHHWGQRFEVPVLMRDVIVVRLHIPDAMRPKFVDDWVISLAVGGYEHG